MCTSCWQVNSTVMRPQPTNLSTVPKQSWLVNLRGVTRGLAGWARSMWKLPGPGLAHPKTTEWTFQPKIMIIDTWLVKTREKNIIPVTWFLGTSYTEIERRMIEYFFESHNNCIFFNDLVMCCHPISYFTSSSWNKSFFHNDVESPSSIT